VDVLTSVERTLWEPLPRTALVQLHAIQVPVRGTGRPGLACRGGQGNNPLHHPGLVADPTDTVAILGRVNPWCDGGTRWCRTGAVTEQRLPGAYLGPGKGRWTPAGWSDVVEAAAGGLLDESHWVDLKQELPAANACSTPSWPRTWRLLLSTVASW
jgi:hypothetical protein